MYAGAVYPRERLKFLAKRNFDPEQAARAYTAMRDATPDQLGEDALWKRATGATADRPGRRRHPAAVAGAATAPLVARGGTVTLADGTVTADGAALPPR